MNFSLWNARGSCFRESDFWKMFLYTYKDSSYSSAGWYLVWIFDAWSHSGQLVMMRWLAGDKADVLPSAERWNNLILWLNHWDTESTKPGVPCIQKEGSLLIVWGNKFCLLFKWIMTAFSVTCIPIWCKSLSLSLIFMTLHLMATLPSPTPTYYNLFQYTSFFKPHWKTTISFWKYFVFPLTNLCVGCPTFQKYPLFISAY